MLVNMHFQNLSKVTVTDYDKAIYIKFLRGMEMRLRIQNS